jgi:hypothetical protein
VRINKLSLFNFKSNKPLAPETQEPVHGAIYAGRDLNNLLWRDLKTDEERLEFIRCGRAVATGILAQTMVNDLIAAYEKICNQV